MKKNSHEFYPVALTIAGSDSGGGAGIQADLRTFNAYGVFGTSVITAVTSQNPMGVSRIDSIAPEGIASQLKAVLDAFEVSAIKIGMMGGAAAIDAVAEALKEYRGPVVVDPVMVATSGSTLLEKDAVSSLRDKLLPLAACITPNLPEAEILLGRKIQSQDEMSKAAVECAKRWKCVCVLKGGHASWNSERNRAVDFVCMEDGSEWTLTTPWADVPKLTAHGTGCTFSSAVAAALALGMDWKESLAAAKGFVFGSLSEAVEPGDGFFAMYPPEESYLEQVIFRKKKKG